MTNSEKSCAILQNLTGSALALVQAAINGNLSEHGGRAFDTLQQNVTNVQPWLGGVEHLTKAPTGEVYWKGIEVEHYTFRGDHERERQAATALGARCRSLEERGFPINGRTSGIYSPFENAPAGTPWSEAMLHYYTAFEDEGKAKWLILSLPNRAAVALSVVRGEIVLRFSRGDMGCYTLFHVLQNEGLHSCGERLRTYEGFVTCMKEAGITPEAVGHCLAAGLPERPGSAPAA